jgi:hypothetical protein
MDKVFQIENAGAGMWKILQRFKYDKTTTYEFREEVAALMDSLYGPKIPTGGIIIPDRRKRGESTMQALAESKRSDFSISGDST